jgi:hypothetical protein
MKGEFWKENDSLIRSDSKIDNLWEEIDNAL